jgi:hypothetical protein
MQGMGPQALMLTAALVKHLVKVLVNRLVKGKKQ